MKIGTSIYIALERYSNRAEPSVIPRLHAMFVPIPTGPFALILMPKGSTDQICALHPHNALRKFVILNTMKPEEQAVERQTILDENGINTAEMKIINDPDLFFEDILELSVAQVMISGEHTEYRSQAFIFDQLGSLVKVFTGDASGIEFVNDIMSELVSLSPSIYSRQYSTSGSSSAEEGKLASAMQDLSITTGKAPGNGFK
jgi:hypothetical protein